jgi:hypothetical protein
MQETVVKQSQESLSSLPVLYTRDDSQSIQYHPIQGAIQLWATLSEKDTVVVYQQAAGKTWELIKQVFTVIFFLFSLVIALIIWAWGIAFQSGLNFRNWLEVKQPTLGEIVSALLIYLAWSFKHAYEWAASFIKKYLGWEIKFEPPTAKSPGTQLEEATGKAVAASESSSAN